MTYVDNEFCSEWQWGGSTWFEAGLYTPSGSFKFGRHYRASGTNLALACAAIYLQPLTGNDLRVIRQKCFDTLNGQFDGVLLEPRNPIALWPMSGHSGGFNSRGLSHARYSMVSPVPNPFGLENGAMQFSGNNYQYFWAHQSYASNLDVCSWSKSFTISAYAKVQSSGVAVSFHTNYNGIVDNSRDRLGYGIQMSFLDTSNDLRYTTKDSSPITEQVNGVIGSTYWQHVTMSYDYSADNLFMFVNGTRVYSKSGLRYASCQSSGSINFGRSAAFPITLTSLAASPLTGAMYCSQIYAQGLHSTESVKRSQKYCSHPEYIGCYPAKPSGSHDFRLAIGHDGIKLMTVAICRKLCGRQLFRFSALTNGDTCFCGNSYGNDGPETSAMCNDPCPGNANDRCGDEKHFSVYSSDSDNVVAKPTIRSVDYAGCPPAWYLRDRSCYRIFTETKNMNEAMGHCHLYGAQLASIESDDENNFIVDMATSFLTAGNFIGIGINSTTAFYTRGKNMDGSSNLYAKWAGSQPAHNNYWGTILVATREWHGSNPINPMYFVCKKPVSMAPTFTVGAKCEIGWSQHENACYLFKEELLPQKTAAELCKSYGNNANLVKVESGDQWDFIRNITDLQRPFWLGLEFDSPTERFRWLSDNSEVGQMALWAGDERFLTNLRPCVFADSRTRYYWRTADCELQRFASVCQYEMSPESEAPIGMTSGKILNIQLKESGIVNGTSTGIENVRLYADKSWCFDGANVPSVFVTIDLRQNYSISAFLFRGSIVSSEWVEQAGIEYSVDHGQIWSDYGIVTVNNASYFVTKYVLSTPIVANKIRITPTAFNVRPCMQVEMIGSRIESQRLLDIAYKPIVFDLQKEAGSFVRLNASLYMRNNRIVSKQELEGQVTGHNYVLSSRKFGNQTLVLSGIDAENNRNVLKHSLSTGRKVKEIKLNSCPIAILYGKYAACEIRVVGGTDFEITTNYGFESRGPRIVKAENAEAGSVAAPSTLTQTDGEFIYMMPNQAVKQNMTVYGIEADISTVGFITVQIYVPHCTNGTYFCPTCHCCLASSSSIPCSRQKAYDSYSCGTTASKNTTTCNLHNSGTELQRTGHFNDNNPTLEYRFLREWRKYFTTTGKSLVFLDEGETSEVAIGSILAYYRSPDDSGRITPYTSSSVKEFYFEKSLDGFSNRHSIQFVVPKTRGTAVQIMHPLKLVGVRSVGVSFGRKWVDIEPKIYHIQFSVQDKLFPDNLISYTYDLEVQQMCIGFTVEFPYLADGGTKIPFYVPPHNGSRCQYEINFGDDTTPLRFDYLERNLTYHHVYRLFGEYNVTLTVWNLVGSRAIALPVKVVFPVAKMSIYMANPPVTEYESYTSIVASYAQASSATTEFQLDLNGTSGSMLSKSFTPCPSGWMSGYGSIGVDACYRYFYMKSLTFDQAESFCTSYGASLVDGMSEDEWTFVKQVMTISGGPTDQGAWTAFSQLKNDFKFWVSSDGKNSIPPPFWQSASGIHPVDGQGLCGYFDYASRKIQNAQCDAIKPFVCRRETAIDSYCGPSDKWKYDPISNRCFQVVSTLSTFIEAIVKCRRMGGLLAQPVNEQLSQTLVKYASSEDSDMVYYVGLWRPENNDWRIFNGWQNYAPTFTNYDPSFQNNVGEICAVLNPVTGKYENIACSSKKPFICEKEVYGYKVTRYTMKTASRRYIPSIKADPTCPIGWTLQNETCYRLVTNAPKSWAAAENDCFDRFQSHLATVKDSSHQSFFHSFIGAEEVWIGLAEISTGVWIWKDGTPLNSAEMPWAVSQPISGQLGFAYYQANTQYWSEGTGAELKAYVCSKPALFGEQIWGGNCPSGYTEFNGQCYKFTATSKTKANAMEACFKEGAGLATIDNKEAFDFIKGMMPLSTSVAFVGAIVNGGTWSWENDVRGINKTVNYESFWATGEPSLDPGCGAISRAHELRVISKGCSETAAYFCSQPAALCPPQWTSWAGNCYRSFSTVLKVYPDSDYDTAKVPCHMENALPISPVNTYEFDLAIQLAGSGKRFGFGYQRIGTSVGFSEMWGRPSILGGATGQPASGNSNAFYGGSGSGVGSVSFTSSLGGLLGSTDTEASVCVMPSKLTPEKCNTECLSYRNFDCLTYIYDGKSCHFMSHRASDNWQGLRESFGKSDVYTVREDLCSKNILDKAVKIYDSEDSNVNLISQIGLDKEGFVATNETGELTIDFANVILLTDFVMAKRSSANEFVKTFRLRYTFDASTWSTYQYPPGSNHTFIANSVEAPIVRIRLPQPVLAKSFIIEPVTFEKTPSFRLAGSGCDAAIFMDYADISYNPSGYYAVKATGSGPRNNLTSETITVAVQSKLLSASITKVPALPHGDWAEIPFTYGDYGPYAYPIANGTFNGTTLRNATIDAKARKGKSIFFNLFVLKVV